MSVDRVQLIVDTSSLIADAAQRGDDRAADILRRVVAFAVQADAAFGELAAMRAAEAERREADARRKRRDRWISEDSTDFHGQTRSPRISEDSTDFHGIRRTNAPCPTEISSSSELQQQQQQRVVVESSARARSEDSTDFHGQERESGDEDERVLQRCDMLRGQVGDADFPTCDAFVRRRPYHTWLGWLDGMLAMIGPGSQFSPADLVRVCADDAALERPIASPRGLRSFLLSAKAEREQERDGSQNGARPTKTQKALRALEGL